MKDYYKILNIDKTASKDEIKKAFRKLAHQYHPDKNTGNDAAAQKFKEASEAYSILSDDNKRKQYDMFGSAGPGFNPGQGGWSGGDQGFGGFQGFGNGQNFKFDFSNFSNGSGAEFDIGDIFEQFFGGRSGRKQPRRGANITIDVKIPFRESVFGVEKEVSIAGRERLLIKIPAGIESGQGLRIPNKGEEGEGGRGDLVVRIWVDKHPIFRKDDFNIIMELPVKLTSAITGDTLTIETLDGQLEIKIPAGTSHNDILRVRNKGVPDARGRRGDLLIILKVQMPKKISRDTQKLIDELKKQGI